VALAGSVPRVLLERYELRELAGRGGMGEVWLGWDRRLQRDVAVKLLLPELSAEPSFRERFAREARSAALEHPNIVDVYDIDQDGDTLFIVMERLPGPSLDARLAQGPMSDDEVRRLAADMLAGLGAAHQEGTIHRDIKPGNLIRSAGGRWKIGDFGVAKDLASTATLTMVGVPVGTPAYLAPEQLAGRPATPATDLWAAAVVLREALTGRRPFPGDDPIEVAHAVQHVPLAPMATVRPDVDPHIAAALDRALTADPGQRFASAGAMLAALEGRPSAVANAGAGSAAADPVVAAPAVPGPSVPPVAPAPDGVAAGSVPAAGPSPAPSPAVLPGPPPDDTGSAVVRAGAVAVLVLAVLALLFLIGVAVGLVMVGGDDDPAEEPGTTMTTATTSAAPDRGPTDPPDGGAEAEDTPPGEGLLPTDPSEPSEPSGPAAGGDTRPDPGVEEPDGGKGDDPAFRDPIIEEQQPGATTGAR
jgi:serine/threonine-protein kinase